MYIYVANIVNLLLSGGKYPRIWVGRTKPRESTEEVAESAQKIRGQMENKLLQYQNPRTRKPVKPKPFQEEAVPA